MKCPACGKDVISFRQIMRSNLWKPSQCSNCSKPVIARPLSHLLVTFVFPLAFIAPFWLYNSGQSLSLIVQFAIGTFTAIITALIIYRLLPIAELGSRSYKIERNILF